MCSTPRCSAKPRNTHRLSESMSSHHSYLKMMRNASQRYEQRQEELAKRQARQAQKSKPETDENNTLNLEYNSFNEGKSTQLKKPEAGFFMHLIQKIVNLILQKTNPHLS